MGLDISHDAFSGAYSAFNRLRQTIAAAMGGSFPPHANKELYPDDNYWYSGEDYARNSHPGLYEFMSHSDCDGVILPGVAAQLADELEELLPKIESMGLIDSGHIAGAGGYPAVVRRLITGCRLAAERNEPLEFL
jgi:hypothetical protein